MAAVPLGEAIRRCYEGKFTQDQLAKAIDESQPSISRWARGEVEPTPSDIWNIEQACGRPPGFVLRLAGYVEEASSVEGALGIDDTLDDDGRRYVLAVYREAQRLASGGRDEPEGHP